uniref:Uncharacterized protein n=1 Tax=Rheinheimera sp. BAL341 TaxID=1708203 RepID=A0A486XH38_9GAMM
MVKVVVLPWGTLRNGGVILPPLPAVADTGYSMMLKLALTEQGVVIMSVV